MKENIILNSQFVDYDLFPVEEIKKTSNQIVGGIAKHLLIVKNSADSAPDLVAFLAKILAAVKFDLAQDAGTLDITPDRRTSLVSVCQNADIKDVIIFGIQPQALGLNIGVVKNHPTSISGIQFIFTDSLSDMNTNAALKKPFWLGLQKMFA